MKEKYINDIKEIKDIMNRSSRFLSLSGWSGISVGVVAGIAAYLAYELIFKGHALLQFKAVSLSELQLQNLLLLAIGALVVSIALVFILTTRETRKRNQKIWDTTSKRILLNLAIPLFTGGILCLIFLSHGFIGLLPGMSMVFYGLALIHVSKFTLPEIRSLGIYEVILGILAFQFVEYALIAWTIGFGLLHIIYGIVVTRKYKS